MRGNLWTREEMILAFNLYLKLPFGKLHTHTPEIQELAQLIGRSVNSVALRLVNYASCDPYLQSRGIKGMVGGQKQCQPIWDEFANNREALIFESERILADKENISLETKFDKSFPELKDLKGETKMREVKTRINQNVFRQIVLVNYNNKCAITGIDVPELLLASHIIPWASNEKERLNPENGICLSALYDRAFDKGLIGVNANYEIILSTKLKKNKDKDYFAICFAPIENVKLQMPQKYYPNPKFWSGIWIVCLKNKDVFCLSINKQFFRLSSLITLYLSNNFPRSILFRAKSLCLIFVDKSLYEILKHQINPHLFRFFTPPQHRLPSAVSGSTLLV